MAKSHPDGLYLRAQDPSSPSSSEYLIKPGFCSASDASRKGAKEPRRAGGGRLGTKAAVGTAGAGAGAGRENRPEKAKRGGNKNASKEARKARREATRDGGGDDGGGDEDADAKGMHQAEKGIEALIRRAVSKLGATPANEPDGAATPPVVRFEDMGEII